MQSTAGRRTFRRRRPRRGRPWRMPRAVRPRPRAPRSSSERTGSNGWIATVARSSHAADPPGPGEDAVDQDRAHRGPVARRQRDGPPGRDDPRAVGVAEQDVVVLGQEPHRRGRVRIRARGVRQVEQLAPALVAEGPEPRPQAVEHDAQPGQAGPRLGIHDRRRPERGQVAEDQRLQRRARLERPAEPGLHRRPATGPVRPQTPRGGTWTSGLR